jgi:hypothetical protein
MEGFRAGACEVVEYPQGASDQHGHLLAEVGRLQVGPGDLGVRGLVLDRRQLAVGRQGASEPDGAVARQGPHLEDPVGTASPREDVQEAPDARRDGDVGKSGSARSSQRLHEDLVGWPEQAFEVTPAGRPPDDRFGLRIRAVGDRPVDVHDARPGGCKGGWQGRRSRRRVQQRERFPNDRGPGARLTGRYAQP